MAICENVEADCGDEQQYKQHQRSECAAETEQPNQTQLSYIHARKHLLQRERIRVSFGVNLRLCSEEKHVLVAQIEESETCGGETQD